MSYAIAFCAGFAAALVLLYAIGREVMYEPDPFDFREGSR